MNILDTGAQLYKSIIENPDEDTVRLEYADFLQESGDENRAQFIRIQCKLKELENRHILDNDLGVIESLLWIKNGEDWSKEFLETFGIQLKVYTGYDPSYTRYADSHKYVNSTIRGGIGSGMAHELDHIENKLVRWFFKRGFIEEIHCTARDWLNCANKLVWNPLQSYQCGYCKEKFIDYETGVIECKQCECTGWLYEETWIEYTPTVQPIKEVVITSVNLSDIDEIYDKIRYWGMDLQDAFSNRWHWINFKFDMHYT